MVDKNDLKDYSFDLDQDLENICPIAIYKIEREENIIVFFSNFFNLGFGFKFILCFLIYSLRCMLKIVQKNKYKNINKNKKWK